MVHMGPRMTPTMGPIAGPNPSYGPVVGGDPMPEGPNSTFTIEPGDSWLYLADPLTLNIVDVDGLGPFWAWSDGQLPDELSTSTDYYAIRTNGDPGVVNDTIKLALSEADALANIWVQIDTLGTGTHYLIYVGA